MCVIICMFPYNCCAEAKKLCDPQGILFRSLITVMPSMLGDPKGSPLKIAIEVDLVKSVGIKVKIQHFI